MYFEHEMKSARNTSANAFRAEGLEANILYLMLVTSLCQPPHHHNISIYLSIYLYFEFMYKMLTPRKGTRRR